MDSKELIQKLKKSRLDKHFSYIVLYENGYYADKQPNYEWSFTDNMLLAKHYKTFNTASKRAMYILKHYPLISIQKVCTITDTKNEYTSVEYKISETYDVSIIKDIYNKNVLKISSKKYKNSPEINKPLTVNVIKLESDDDFWN
jgi:hypothetical protein